MVKLYFKEFYMSKLKSVGILVAALCCLVSCNKNAKTTEPAPDALSTTPNGERQGVVLLNGTGLYVEQEDGKMKYASSANAGDVYNLILVKPEGAKEKVCETKEAERVSPAGKRNFYHISKEDKEFWVQDALFAPDTVPAIITATDAVMYTKPDISSVVSDGSIFPQYQIVGVGDSEKGFTATYAYIEKTISATSLRYVKGDCYTTSSDDIKAYQMYTSAINAKNNTVEKTLLQNALELHSSFDDLIQKTYDAKFTDSAENDDSTTDAEITTEDDSLVNVRESPDSTSKVVTQLKTGQRITAALEGSASETIDDFTGDWVEIVYPVNGYVFSQFILYDSDAN